MERWNRLRLPLGLIRNQEAAGSIPAWPTKPLSNMTERAYSLAPLGYIVGRTTARVNNAPIEEKRPIVTVSPILGPDTRGVQVAIGV